MARFKVYVDGSYNKEEKIVYGAFVMLDNDNPVMIYRITTQDERFINQWNVGGELLAAAAGIVNTFTYLRVSVEEESCEDTYIEVYYDYIGIRNFIVPPKDGKRPHKPKDKSAGVYYQRMVNMVLEQNYPFKIKFIKVKAHTGDKWNELADRIAGGFVKEYNGLKLIEQTL